MAAKSREAKIKKLKASIWALRGEKRDLAAKYIASLDLSIECISELRGEIETLKGERQAWDDQLGQIRAESDDRGKIIERQVFELNAQADKISDLDAEIETLKGERQAWDDQLGQIRAESSTRDQILIGVKSARIRDLETRLGDREARLRGREDYIAKLEAEIETVRAAARDEIKTLDDKLAEMAAAIGAKNARHRDLELRLEGRLKTEARIQEVEIGELKGALTKAHNTVEDQAGAIEILNEANAAQSARIRDLEELIDADLETEASDRADFVRDLKIEIEESLEDLATKLTGHVAAAIGENS